ncbi:LDH2 family malate/lactate/ureidoglycolate dehydrogenase [Terracoccus luteus]|uniref:LDH2 family malate/lactate/ureidoglycolate dehydrogenase n=1 Tax=Terracoccus luteus TaxID=53356 RepID=A0A495Y4F4_9MICO|nr:Ldh family oxidoreductase [Terracoccus luteus]RKT79388.1 LDH2 family malate/lactate/ureidoglycolate dehydrogenase [Terracoccus luteus]
MTTDAGSDHDVTVDPDDLRRFVTDAFVATGVPEPDAVLLADTLVVAELWGHVSHGVIRLPWYLARLRTGATRAVTTVETVRDAGSVVVLDGHDGIGQVVTQRAVETGVERARRHGVAAVAVRGSGHFGTAAYFTRQVAQAGCIALLATNASPAMAPWGARTKLVGTNPWSIAAPGPDGEALVLDLANTAVARGKVYVAADRGEPIPSGWAADAEGNPTTDARAALEGLILPMAGPKGYVMSFMFDVLAGVLTGSAFGADVVGPYRPTGRSGAGHLLIVLDVAAFGPRDEYDERVARLVDEVHAADPAPWSDGALVPGELENRARVATERTGIRLSPSAWQQLRAVADDTGATLPTATSPTKPTTRERN